MVSMSVADNGSDEIGSAGTGSGSRTGSGGDGGRVLVEETAAGGGVVGFATGGFFLAHAPAATSAIATIVNTRRLCIISILSRNEERRTRTKYEERRTKNEEPFVVCYCDQFGYLFMPDRVIWRRFFPSRSI